MKNKKFTAVYWTISITISSVQACEPITCYRPSHYSTFYFTYISICLSS